MRYLLLSACILFPFLGVSGGAEYVGFEFSSATDGSQQQIGLVGSTAGYWMSAYSGVSGTLVK